MELRFFLQNWIYGLLGWEEKTHKTARKLTNKLIEKGEVKIVSTYTDYEHNENYYFRLEISKKKFDDIPVTINVEDAGIVHKLIKEFDNCSYSG